MKPKVSICVPVYKVEKYIERCAVSLFNQTLDNLEFIFVDDCSPDNSFQVLQQTVKKYPNLNIKIIKLSQNLGPGLARKKAAEYASGEFLYIPDSDDWIDPTMLEEMYSLSIDQNADLIKCRQVIETNNNSIKSKHFYPSNNTEWFNAVVRRETSIGLCSYLINHELYKKATSGISEERMVRFEDYLLTIRLHYYSKKCILLDKYMYHINRSNNLSITKTITEEAISSCLRAADLLDSFLKEINYEYYDSDVIIKLREIGFDNYLFDKALYNPDKWRFYYTRYGSTRRSALNINNFIKMLTIYHHDKIALQILYIKKIIKQLYNYYKINFSKRSLLV